MIKQWPFKLKPNFQTWQRISVSIKGLPFLRKCSTFCLGWHIRCNWKWRGDCSKTPLSVAFDTIRPNFFHPVQPHIANFWGPQGTTVIHYVYHASQFPPTQSQGYQTPPICRWHASPHFLQHIPFWKFYTQSTKLTCLSPRLDVQKQVEVESWQNTIPAHQK